MLTSCRWDADWNIVPLGWGESHELGKFPLQCELPTQRRIDLLLAVAVRLVHVPALPFPDCRPQPPAARHQDPLHPIHGCGWRSRHVVVVPGPLGREQQQHLPLLRHVSQPPAQLQPTVAHPDALVALGPAVPVEAMLAAGAQTALALRHPACFRLRSSRRCFVGALQVALLPPRAQLRGPAPG